MDILYQLCRAISFGIIFGFLFGARRFFHRPTYTPQKIASTKKLMKQLSLVIEYITFVVLTLGLLWCIYYLFLGIDDPAQAEYATNISQLIVSVLTIISIIFAFFEFLHGEHQTKD